jgi:hypothetical protein
MKKKTAALIAILTALSASASAKTVIMAPPPVNGCLLFGHIDYKGGSFLLSPNDEFVQFSKDIDNKISSVQVGKYCVLDAYSEWLFSGHHQRYMEGWYPAIQPNDAMTSARCICEYVDVGE